MIIHPRLFKMSYKQTQECVLSGAALYAPYPLDTAAIREIYIEGPARDPDTGAVTSEEDIAIATALYIAGTDAELSQQRAPKTISKTLLDIRLS